MTVIDYLKYWGIAVLLFLFSCRKSTISSNDKLEVSVLKPSFVNSDHASESLLVTLQNGFVIHLFRLDSSSNGDHIGNAGKIVSRISTTNGESWGAVNTIYDDEFDDRNIRGGITKDGVIVAFFRRYDATKNKPVDLNYILSYDGGQTWTKRFLLDFKISDDVYEVWVDNFIDIGSNEYLLPVHGVGYCEMKVFRIANESVVFNKVNWKWDYSKKLEYGIDEPYISITSDPSKLICLFRDDTKFGTYYSSISSDKGITWSNPARTNIADGYFCPSPLIFYHSGLQKNIVVATDRRHISTNSILDAKQSKIWIYANSVTEISLASNNYTLVSKIDRPRSTEYMFYGYPAYTKTKDGNYLIIVTDSMFDGINEDGDLYQFTVK